MTDTQPQFDVFMAHNSLDKEYIRNINQKLKRSRLKTWLDEDAILAGQIIQDEIQKVIPQIKSAAIFVGTQGLGKWQKVELRSLYTQCVEKGIIVIPVLLPGVIEFPPELVFLKEHKWVSFVNDIEDEELPLSYKLEFALWHFNHTKQYRWFKHLTKSVNIVGFRIKISEDKRISLIWLLKSLLKSKDTIARIAPIYSEFDLRSWSYGTNDFNQLLKDMCGKLQIRISGLFERQKYEYLTKTIVKEIFNKIEEENRHIILIFVGVDKRPKSFLDKLQVFWNDLVTRFKKNKNNSPYLLMFWIDFQNSNDWRDSYTFPEETPLNWKPSTVLNLNIVDRFQFRELDSWVRDPHENSLAEIDYQLVENDTKLSSTIDRIWKESEEGEPKALLKALYRVCNISWEEHESKWQNFH